MSLSMVDSEERVSSARVAQRVWQTVKLSLFLTRSNILSAMEYRASFLTQVIGMIVNDAGFTILWYIFFQRFPTINGWTWQDSALLFAITTTNFSFVFIFVRGAHDLARTIRQGELDYFLGFPKDVLWHVSFSRTAVDAIGDLLFGIAMFVIFVPITLKTTLVFFVASLLSAIVMYSFIVLSQTLAFYVSNLEDAARDIFELLLGFSFYPQNIFTGGIRLVTIFIVPAFFTTNVPHQLVTHFTWELLGILAVAAGVMLTAAILFFRYSLRKYESGNLIAVRM